MRLALTHLAFGFFLAGTGLAAAQQAEEVVEAEAAAPVVLLEGTSIDLGETGEFTFGFGRPSTFDNLRIDTREALRPPESFGPVGTVPCSPSVPDC